MKHTQGTWEVKKENEYVPAQVWADGRLLADVYGESRETRHANAQLMAVSPDLLQQLEFCCEQLQECMEQNHGQIWSNAQTVLANAQATIEQAKK